MDNASFHTHEKIRGAIKAVGAQLKFLLFYSSDLNPIEKKWAHEDVYNALWVMSL